ncbi:MAG TPA: RnfABCDGE type electron transport complex subunit B [Burkholderiales bacterium]|nr:RnfABCDGE type electron transport complex subunit B [Burkholderiales bacterium]
METLADRIDALLPQTQCRQCGYPGCRPYAEAVAAGRADINRCPPGGPETMHALADLTGRPVTPLEGIHKPPAVARIDEPACIGCTLCIHACPVDAIVGAVNAMHTVIAAECTGCELCIPVCPVDCIAMIEAGAPAGRGFEPERAARYRQRFLAREARLERERDAREETARTRANERRKRATITRVMQRARQRLRERG